MKKYANYKEDFETKKRRKRRWRIIRWILFICIVCVGVFFVLFFAGLFDVRKISVHSPSLISSSLVEAKAWETISSRFLGIPRMNNSIVFSPQDIVPVLKKEFPRIDSVSVRRVSFHELTIVVKERLPVGLWCLTVKNACYYYDIDGNAFSQVSSSSGFLFVAMNDSRDREIVLNGPVEDTDWREHLQEIKKLLQFGGIGIRNYSISADAQDEFAVVTSEEWRILYVNDDSIRSQTNALLVFLKEKLTVKERASLDYIDLRIEDRIYYKTKE